MKRTLVSFLLLVACIGSAHAQATRPDQAAKADAMVQNIRKLDVLRHIMPIAMTKSQYNELLTVIEKVRANVRKISDSEFEELKKRDERVSTMVKQALEEGKFPDRALIIETTRVISAFGIRRNTAAQENVDLVLEFVNKKLNDGQRKLMINAIDWKEIDPTLKEAPEDKIRMRYFIADILLDPLSYDLMIQLAKRAS